MSVELHEEAGGKVLILNLNGKLAKEDYAHFTPEVEHAATGQKTMISPGPLGMGMALPRGGRLLVRHLAGCLDDLAQHAGSGGTR